MSKKHSTKIPKPASQVETGRLDERVTDAFVSAKKGLIRYWKVVVAVVVAGVLVIGLIQLVDALAESKERGYHQRLYELTSAALDSEDVAPPIDGLLTLMNDVRGAEAEKAVLKQGAEFLLGRAQSLQSKTERTEEDETERLECLKAAETIAAMALDRFPAQDAGSEDELSETADLHKWADNVRRVAEAGMDETPGKYKKRRFELPTRDTTSTPESNKPGTDGTRTDSGN